MAILYKKGQTGVSTTPTTKEQVDMKANIMMKKPLEDSLQSGVNTPNKVVASKEFKPNYNQTFGYKTQDGSDVYLMRESVEAGQHDDIHKFDDGLMYTTNKDHIPNMGGYQGMNVDEEGNPYFLSNASGDSSRVRALVEGRMPGTDLMYK